MADEGARLSARSSAMAVQTLGKKIIFHIGLEKTGTTSFQRFCYENRRGLLARGVLYPTRSLAFSHRSRNHASLVAAYLEGASHIDLDMTPSWRSRSEVVASLREEIGGTSAPAVLISAEHLSSRLRSREIGLLAQDFADCDCLVATTLRAHEARVCSAYSSTIRAGRALTLQEFVAELTAPGNPYIRCKETLALWENAFGRANVKVFCLAPGGDVIGDLISGLVASDFPAGDAAAYADNQSFGASALEALRRVNARLPVADGSGRGAVKLAIAGLARATFLKGFARVAGKRAAERLRLGANERAALAELIEADRAWLQEHYGVDLPPPAEGGAGLDAAELDRKARELMRRCSWKALALLRLARAWPQS